MARMPYQGAFTLQVWGLCDLPFENYSTSALLVWVSETGVCAAAARFCHPNIPPPGMWRHVNIQYGKEPRFGQGPDQGIVVGKRDGTESTNHRSLRLFTAPSAVSCQQEFTAISNQRRVVGEPLDADWRAGGRRKVGAFSSLLPKSEWRKAKSLYKKVRALESSFQKVYILSALALQDFSHRLLKVGHFQSFR